MLHFLILFVFVNFLKLESKKVAKNNRITLGYDSGVGYGFQKYLKGKKRLKKTLIFKETKCSFRFYHYLSRIRNGGICRKDPEFWRLPDGSGASRCRRRTTPDTGSRTCRWPCEDGPNSILKRKKNINLILPN